ncbi:hypothetical protein KCU71_g2735, partial [Aureobasidium melanogenum]
MASTVADPVCHSGVMLKVEVTGNATYEVSQIPLASQLPKVVRGAEDDRVGIDRYFGFGSEIIGYVIKSTLEIGVQPSFGGIKLPAFYGNLKDGLVIKVYLSAMDGPIKFYLKDGNEVWVYMDLNGVAEQPRDTKLLSL